MGLRWDWGLCSDVFGGLHQKLLLSGLECIENLLMNWFQPITYTGSLASLAQTLFNSWETRVVGLIANLPKYSKNNLIDVQGFIYSGILKDSKQNVYVDKYRNESKSL